MAFAVVSENRRLSLMEETGFPIDLSFFENNFCVWSPDKQDWVWQANGDLLVIVSSHGLFWDGVSWVLSWRDAEKFDRYRQAYDECYARSKQVRANTGIACCPLYIP